MLGLDFKCWYRIQGGQLNNILYTFMCVGHNPLLFDDNYFSNSLVGNILRPADSLGWHGLWRKD